MTWILVLAAVLIVAAVALSLSHPEPPGRIQPHELELAEVRRLAETGRTIAAIELYRSLTGAELGEAKKAVERIVRGEPPHTPPPAPRA